MLGFSPLAVAVALILALFVPLLEGQKSEVNAARLQAPIIASIAPSFGSVEGGTWLTITGTNFAQHGIFTNRAVFIAGQLCQEISYYTSNTQITCVVPKCVQPECLSAPLWSDSVRVSLDVYIQGVEGIKSASSTFLYHGGYTPMVMWMMRYVRNSAYFLLQGRTSNPNLSAMEVRIGENLANLGESGDVNPSTLSMWTNSQNLFYQPVIDNSAGFYNLTLTARYESSAGYVGTGKARMFPKQRPLSASSYFSRYNFDATWSGQVYSVAVQPVIYSVSPRTGSLAGGTTVKISGAGFSLVKELNTVFVGGYLCEVQAATASLITCVTPSIDEELESNISRLVTTNSERPEFSRNIELNSSRHVGSPGWWIRYWSLADYYSNQMTDNNVILSLGHRGDSLFSLYYLISSTWEQKIGLASKVQTFAADFESYLIAPLEGSYYFYISSDDISFLYCKKEGDSSETTLFNNILYSEPNNIYTILPQRTSQKIYMLAGQRLKLRARLVNTMSADYLSIGLRIDPTEEVSAISFVVHGDGNHQHVDLTNPSFLHHHALRDIQVVSLAINYQREVQTLVIANVASGSFRIILQNLVATDVLTFASTSSQIANALYYAALEIPAATRLCSSFGASRSFANSGNTMFIRVEFYCDNSQPLPMIYAYTADLVPLNNNLTTFTQRNQLHTPIPSGQFVLSIPITFNNSSGVEYSDLLVPFDSSADNLRNLMQNFHSEITVDVTRSGSAYSGFSWTVTFVTPRGDIPSLLVNTSDVSGSNVRGRVLQAQNGSTNSLWFQSIPPWMTEVPLEYATHPTSGNKNEFDQTVQSNVEVYVRQGRSKDEFNTADVSKAACDATTSYGDYENAVWRQLVIGDESTCRFTFSSETTPLVSTYRKVDIDLERSYLEIWGSGFTSFDVLNPMMEVTVSVAKHPCNITFVNDSFISCNVASVPWGRHVPKVTVSTVGDALILARDPLVFTQEIVSIEPNTGSFAGGQVVNIRGRGFRWNATVMLLDAEANQYQECHVMYLTSSHITCRVPSVRYVFTNQPTSLPSSRPSIRPTALPSSKPSVVPSAAPTQPTSVPSQAPSRPTVSPSFAPTITPTVSDGDIFGTASPTEDIGTFIFPTPEPTTEPTLHADIDVNLLSINKRDSHDFHIQDLSADLQLHFPQILNNANRRLSLSESIESLNSRQVFVDGMTSISNPTAAFFHYSEEFTPVIEELYPTILSAAVSSNISVSFQTPLIFELTSSAQQLSDFMLVTIGGQVCTNLRSEMGEFSDVSIVVKTFSCFLMRNKSYTSATDEEVVVDVFGKGYAGLATETNKLPSIRRGFEIRSVSPTMGSLLGGNVLRIGGYGFIAGQPQLHQVNLKQVNGVTYNEYDQLLLALGFSPSTQVPSHTYLNCEVTEVHDDYLLCVLRDHRDPYPEADYDIFIVVNNVSSNCRSDDGLCRYSQRIDHTPIVGEDLSIIEETSMGEYTITVPFFVHNQEAFTKETITVKVQEKVCNVLSVSNSSITFESPALSHEFVEVVVFLDGYGRASSVASFQPLVEIHNVEFASTNGSVAGGTQAIITGRGFSDACEKNNLILNIQVRHSQVSDSLQVTEMIDCSVTSIKFRTPSILHLLPDSVVSSRYMGFAADLFSIVYGNASSVSSASFAISDFSFTMSASPSITFMNSTSGFAGDTILLTVTAMNVDNQLSARMDNVEVTMLRVDPVSTSNMGKSITSVVTVPALPASSKGYPLFIEVSPYGYAISNTSQPVRLPFFKSKQQVDLFPSIMDSSVEGGLNLHITGKGLNQQDAYVSLCHQNCTVISANYDELICQLPARMPMDAVTSLSSQGFSRDTIVDTLPGKLFSSLNSASTAALVRDGDKATYYSHSSIKCSIGLELPADMVAQPYRMIFYPRIAYANRIKSFVFEGRLAGQSSFSTLAVGYGVREGWNYLEAQNGTNMWFTAFRYRIVEASVSSSCQLAELSFSGTLAYNRSICPVTLHSPSSGGNVAVGSVQYSLTQTPIISRITPNNGTALGGTEVTLFGENLDSLSNGSNGDEFVSVLLSQVSCQVTSFTSTQITCITSPRPPEKIETSSIVVNVPGRGNAFVPDEVQFQYIDRWSALTTWKNQEPPVEGDVVWIPDGQVILMDQDTPLLTFLLIEGRLYFDRNQPSLHLDSHYVLILGGYMEVGTEDEPYENEAILTLHGDRYTSIDIPMIGVKFICVAEKGLPRMEMNPGLHVPSRYTGQLEVHGKKRLRTWTHVAETITAGSNFLITAEPVDFAPGESVVITGSEIPAGSNNADAYGLEEMTVLENIDGYNITFTTSFRFTHRSEIIFIEGRRIDLRMSIGLLTRNVKIQGDDKNSDGQLMGVHNMAVMSGIFRVENTEVRRCGQAFRFGRYCTHSHMSGNMEGSYVKANSIHHSYQRAVTTHRTSYWEVRDNVAFNVMGHAYFVEDGLEFHNALTGNLGVFILTSSALLHSDLEPSIFWTRGPFNIWRDNVAAHSAGNGFWFELASEQDGQCLVHMGLQEFVNNTFHSNSVFGLKIYPEWTPLQEPCNDASAPLHVYLYNMLSYRNGGNGMFSKKHGAIHHVSPTFVENPNGDVSIVKYPHNEYNMDPTFRDALFVGSINPSFSDNDYAGHYGIWTPQGEYFYVSNTTFVNYGGSGIITGCNHCLSGDDMNQGGFTTRFDQLRFVRSTKRLFWSPTKKEILWDLDGSLAGEADSMVTMYYGHINWPNDCTILDENMFSESIRCGGKNSSVRIRRMQIESVTPSQLSYTDLTIRSDTGYGSVYFLPLDTYGWVFPVVTGENKTYEVVWAAAGISAYTIRYTLGRPEYLIETLNERPSIDDQVTMRFRPNKWDYEPYSFAVTYNSKRKIVPFNLTRPLSNQIADSKYINNTFDVILSNQGTSSSASSRFGVYTEAQLCPPRGCPVPPVPTIGTPMLWSRASSWQSKKVPVGGQQVTIDSNMWIVMDISPPALGCITIYGKLSFLSNITHPRSLVLKTACMKVFGTFEIMGQDNSSFVGDATVILTGTKQNSLPVTMAEGVFLGSKVIGVSGSLRAIGETKNITWLKLRSTAAAGTSSVDLSEEVTWKIGDTILLSPTGYFVASGAPWNSNSDKKGSSDEFRTITAINTILDSEGNAFTRLTVNLPLNHTHLCTITEGIHFCGAVGVMTRTVRFLSEDSQNPATTSYGFGGNIHVFDITSGSTKRYGSINVTNVEFRNFGKINSDHYAIRIDHIDRFHPSSSILSCSFTGGYNFAIRTLNTIGTIFEENVVGGNFGGGVYIDAQSRDFAVNANMVVGTRQMPSVQSSSFPFLRPIAGFAIFSPNGYVTHNLAAGSHDQGFMVAMRLVTLPTRYAYLCTLTRSLSANIVVDDGYYNLRFADNEAVAGRGGVQLVNMGPGENSGVDCASLDRAFAWRNAHTGILALDVRPNLIISNAILAENHIGAVINFFKQTDDVYSGVVNSTIIHSVIRSGSCADGSDSVYLRGKHCAAFTENDPSGLSFACNSVFSNIYRRVGLLLPMSTNRARTCAMERRFECDPPNTPDRLCLLPWEKRYALPNGIQYMEFHLHGNTFVGFERREYNASSSLSGQCIPSVLEDNSAAVAVNPSQVDYQPSVVTSRNNWVKVDDSARFGMDLGAYAETCQYQPCNGQQMLIVHDQDGSFGTTEQQGQFVARNPELTGPYPSCVEVPNMALNLYFCPGTGADSFQQYHGGWLDSLPQIIQPLTTTRRFSDYNRTVASYGPIDDMCAKRFYFSRFNFMFAHNRVNTIMSTGTTPSTIVMRWDAPDDSKSTILHLIVEQSLKINVFVGSSSQGPWIAMPQNATYPLLTSPAGYSQRNPQQRYIAFTATGHNFYRLVMVPVAAVTIRMEMTLKEFYSDTFIANMAMLLQIAASRIKITSVRAGSVIADFEVSPANEVAATSTDLIAQVSELTSVTSNLTRAIASDAISVALNVTILQVFATNPIVEPELNATLDVDTGSSNDTFFNITQYRSSLIAASTPVTITLFTYPTSMPSSQPSRQPSGQPSMIPSGQPSSLPSAQPTSLPTQPTSHPSSRPSSYPSTQPSSLPTVSPSSQPSKQPVAFPSGIPTSNPSAFPTSDPTANPSAKPSNEPSHKPTPTPTANPTTSVPSASPTIEPSPAPTYAPSGPTQVPTIAPSEVPSKDPTYVPTGSPTFDPTFVPSVSPTYSPSASPTEFPTFVPTVDPTFAPSGVPSTLPTFVPTSIPTVEPSEKPSTTPSENPTETPSKLPTESPSDSPTFTPSAFPTSIPSFSPSESPTTAQPSEIPSLSPSVTPTQFPSTEPTIVPSLEPSIVPTAAPTQFPSVVPSPIPTPVPSMQPSETPSESPTFSPSYSPSLIPTDVPSTIPSIEPSQLPSTEPTMHPTASPSAVPSCEPTEGPTHISTFSPSKLPSLTPTVSPTSSIMKQLSFGVTQVIDGVSTFDDVNDLSTRSTLQTLLQSRLDDPSRTVVVNIKDIIASSSSRRTLSTNVAVIVEYLITILIHNPNAMDSDTVFNTVSAALNTYVESGDFTVALQSSGIAALLGASSSALTIESYVETEIHAFPSSSPASRKSTSLSSAEIAYVTVGAIVGGIAIVALLVFIGVRKYPSKNIEDSSQKPKTVAIVPLQSELTFIDIERMNTPDAAQAKQALGAAGVVHTSDGNAEVFVQRRANSQRYLTNNNVKSTTKGRSFFDFVGSDYGGVNGIFTRPSPGKKDGKYECDDNEENAEVESEDEHIDRAEEPDRESLPHLEQAEMTAASPFHRTKLNASSATHNENSSLFFHDDASSVDSDTPIVLRQTSKRPIAPANSTISSANKVQPGLVSDSEASDNESGVLNNDTTESDSHLRSSQNWHVAQVSEKDRHGRF